MVLYLYLYQYIILFGTYSNSSHLGCIISAHHMNMPHAVNTVNDEGGCYKIDCLEIIHI